jgi:hypothetical protein
MNGNFWNGFEKQALMQTRHNEDVATALSAALPMGTTLHTALKDDQGGDRFHEWAGRMAGNIVGSLPGVAMAVASHGDVHDLNRIVHTGRGTMKGNTALGLLLAAAGAIGGEVVANRMVHEGKYDDSGKLKKQFGGR